MTGGSSVDGVLVQWGERLFYPRTRIVKTAPLPRLDAMTRRRAAVIRSRIVATATRRAPQVMVKVTGGGRGMAAIAAHFRYISKNGRLEIEDDRQMKHHGREAMGDLLEQWRYGGSFIGEVSRRREAFNVMLSMPAGTPPDFVRQAAREFAQVELSRHRWVMVLHEHQANPHVHLSVRAESVDGDRLNPRKADLHRWRETFAEKLRGLGIDAEATRQATRGETRHHEALWRLKAKEGGRLRNDDQSAKSGDRHMNSRNGALEAWLQIVQVLEGSDEAADRQLADQIRKFSMASPYLREAARRPQQRAVPVERSPISRSPQREVGQRRPDPDIER
jgi:hypothetical protein